ncbi:alpha-(1-_3)-arabinofuranosyltransferase [Blastococcus sp. LR1]|uniref:alpha-(1->3)-arabinofuranosyltransferase n=1 Tax=Blastococcus sp. LR1 TaxID=2877000 RepID=UPI001CCD8261|nr:alpha-(1->3)-arabinofuranosyltransferase [Blastococcus sp. LR1]MCA0145151.1 alpha-(1->3)-arabinofuranosyltransferase [Blastococcus sp. LR1]
MDPPGPADAEAGRAAGSRMMWRIRLATVCLAFVGLALSQQPGRIIPDTKLDLAVDPWGFLARALHLWEPTGFAGQVQNQAYGYLFPMGPFFGLGSSLGIPVWVVQRLWLALLLSAAFLGVVLLARQLRLGTPTSRLVAGLAYALSARMLTGLGATSIEVLPMALAPWVLLPLVIGSTRGSPRRAAALSGLAVFCVGGVNAVATAAVLPLAALWLLTRPAGARRRRLMAWWAVSVALATTWWAGPLLLLRQYSPPFLDYIETAGTTTAPTGLFSALRGTTQWVAYLADADGPLWPTGWALVHDALPVLGTLVLLTAGVLGLMSARMTERRWIVLGILTGLVLVTAGHRGLVEGFFAPELHSALDGVLAPLRNVHKFDPVLRLPLALGVAVLCARPARSRDPIVVTRAGRLARHGRRLAVPIVAVALVATASPAIGGRLAPPTGFDGVPPYWTQTAQWLAASQPEGRALLVPGSSFGTYAWGTPADEPMQPLARSPWEVRGAVPLTPSAHIRMLDEIEDVLAGASGSPALTRYLARAGISHLVLRNDLEPGMPGVTRAVQVRKALADSPGIRRVARFGPDFPSSTTFLGRVLDAHLVSPRPAVEIYEVRDPAPRAFTVPLSSAVTVQGGPDGILALEQRQLLSGRPALLAQPEVPATGPVLVSDAQLRRERTFGRINEAASAGLGRKDALTLEGPQRDYLYPGWELGESVVRIDGADVSASSSAADAASFGGTDTSAHPYAALDGDPESAWRPANRLGEAQPVWWRIETGRTFEAPAVTVRLGGDRPDSLIVRTDSGERTVDVADTPDPQRLLLPDGPTRRLTIEVPGPGGLTTEIPHLAEVEIDGLDVSRSVVTPEPVEPASAYVFDASRTAGSGCVLAESDRPRCAPSLARAAEEPIGLDRTFHVLEQADHEVGVTVVPRPGPELDDLIGGLARPYGQVLTASSSLVPDPRAGADAAMDGDRDTAWMADPDDPRPTLTMRWATPQTVDRLRVVVEPETAVSRPLAVSIAADGLERRADLDEDGWAEFPALTATSVTITFPLVDEIRSYDPYSRAATTLGVGVSELEIVGRGVGDPAASVALPCGQGPVVQLDGRRLETSVRTTLGGLRALEPFDVEICGSGPVLLAPGDHRFRAESTDVFGVVSAELIRIDADGAAPVRRADVPATRWEAEARDLQVPARTEPALLVLPENVNPGWVATLDGEVLDERTVDGWQQAYVLPAGGAGEVLLRFEPGDTYRTALLTGAGAVLLLILVLLVPARRSARPARCGRSRAGLGTAAVAVLGMALVGGPVALVALVVAGVLGQVAGQGRRWVLPAMAAGALVAAGAVTLTLGRAGPEVATQTLVLVALAALLARLLVDDAGSATRPRHRRSGRSTSQ